ncbi:MAG TPA: hypothetical protein VLS48_05170, partial [Anaerolineales bacterium]|nr:hypothetical protein [Anaerolineales bacterium]
AIRTLHMQRLEQVLALLTEPHTIQEVSFGLFGEVHGYNVLLALEEAGAHVEYLYQRGALGIKNFQEFESRRGPVALWYYRTPGPYEDQPVKATYLRRGNHVFIRTE